VIRNSYKATKPQTGKYTPDNLALMPASLLPLREKFRRLATELPNGDVLMVVPIGPSKLGDVLNALSPALRARGRHITTIAAEALPQKTVLR